MNKKNMILIVFLIVIAAVAVVIFLISKRGPVFLIMDKGGSRADNPTITEELYAQLQGEWTEVNSTSPDLITINGESCQYTLNEKTQNDAFTVSEGENYNLDVENAMTISFEQDKGPMYCSEYVFHTEQIDGHTIRILDSFMYEDDGRGLIIFVEFVHNDDLQYVGTDFTSELYDCMNNAEVVPSYLEVEEIDVETEF